MNSVPPIDKEDRHIRPYHKEFSLLEGVECRLSSYTYTHSLLSVPGASDLQSLVISGSSWVWILPLALRHDADERLRSETATMIEDLLQHMTPGKASLWFLGVFFLACLVRKYQVSAEIARLGTRPPRVFFRIPYGSFPGDPYPPRTSY